MSAPHQELCQEHSPVSNTIGQALPVKLSCWLLAPGLPSTFRETLSREESPKASATLLCPLSLTLLRHTPNLPMNTGGQATTGHLSISNRICFPWVSSMADSGFGGCRRNRRPRCHPGRPRGRHAPSGSFRQCQQACVCTHPGLVTPQGAT